jgi:hypothetical protein
MMVDGRRFRARRREQVFAPRLGTGGLKSLGQVSSPRQPSPPRNPPRRCQQPLAGLGHDAPAVSIVAHVVELPARCALMARRIVDLETPAAAAALPMNHTCRSPVA